MSVKQIGERIKKARKESGYTLTQISADLQMSRNTLSQLEKGIVSELGIRKVIRVCSYLGVELVVDEPALPTLNDQIERRRAYIQKTRNRAQAIVPSRKRELF